MDNERIVDGDLYVYKDPGRLKTSKKVTPRYNPSQGITKPVTRDYTQLFVRYTIKTPSLPTELGTIWDHKLGILVMTTELRN